MNCYLLYGEETYLLRQYREKLREQCVAPEDTVNTFRFEGRDIDPKQIIDLAETMPFFADHRCILVDDSGFFKKGGEALADYVEAIPKSTCLIFSETEVDKRSRLYKKVKKTGCVIEYKRQPENVLMKWVEARVEQEGKQISRSVLELFLSRTGDDMNLIDRELEKLFCYTLGRSVIRQEDIEAVCCVQLSDRIFDMVDAVAVKQRERALSLYRDLLMRKEPPMKILYLLIRQFHILMQIKAMDGCSEAAMAAQTKIPSFAVRKDLRQAACFTQKQLCEAVAGGVQAEEDIKSGLMSDRLAVEVFLMSKLGS